MRGADRPRAGLVVGQRDDHAEGRADAGRPAEAEQEAEQRRRGQPHRRHLVHADVTLSHGTRPMNASPSTIASTPEHDVEGPGVGREELEDARGEDPEADEDDREARARTARRRRACGCGGRRPSPGRRRRARSRRTGSPGAAAGRRARRRRRARPGPRPGSRAPASPSRRSAGTSHPRGSATTSSIASVIVAGTGDLAEHEHREPALAVEERRCSAGLRRRACRRG